MTSVQGRRTVEVRPVQRGHLSKHSHREDYLSATDLDNAWSNMNEAKRVLHRAEHRVDESTMPFPLHSTQGRHTRNKIRLSPRNITPTQDPVTKLYEVNQPGLGFLNGEDFTTSRRWMLRRKYPQERVSSHSGVYSPGGRHTSNPSTSYSGKRYEHKSSRDILDQGSANLSLDDSTNVRILNDVPHEETQNSARTSEFTVEVSPGLKVNRDYIPAYRRLYGDTNYQGRTKHEPLDHGNHGSQPQASTELYERLRRRVESQKQRTNSGRTLNDEILHKYPHKETDPVVYRPNGPPDYTDRGMQDNPPIRKVARAPPPPHYKGFNIPETKFMLPNGRVVSEDTLNSRTHRRKSKHKQESKSTKDLNPLQPSRTQTDNDQNKPARKVHRKKASAARKQTQPDVKASVGAFAWREGAKVVREALGPSQAAKAKTGHSPPTKDRDVRSQNSTSAPPARESLHLDNEGDKHNSNGKVGGSKLPSDALEVLEDLHLNSEQKEEDSEHEDPGDVDLDARQPLSFIVEPGQRKPPLRKAKGNPENEQTFAPVAKVRHYDSREVRKYMVQQKNKRKKKQQELLDEKKEAANRKQKQLEELYKKQKDNAKAARKDVTEGQKDTKASNETFRKEPMVPPSEPVTAAPRRFPPRTQAMRKLDVTSSDKENKAFWSTTSSSDTSSRSSPQTDISGQPAEPHTSVSLHPANREVTGGDIVLIPVTEEGAPIAVVGRQKVSSPEQDVGKVSPPESSGHGNMFATGDTLPSENGPHSNSDERLQALKATAAALHSRLDSEVQKLASDLYSMLPTMQPLPPNGTMPENGHLGNSHQTGLVNQRLDPPSARPDRSLSPRHLTWHNQLGSLENDRWAFSVPSSTVKHSVRFQEDEGVQRQASPFQSRHQKTVAAQSPSPVFTGQLPGVASMNQHASQAYVTKQQEDAATKIQASYRGHSVRQKLKWAAPTLSSSAGCAPRKPKRKGFAEEEEHFTLSEGALSDDAHVELEEDYLPKFQSLRASNHDHLVEPLASPSKPSIATSPQSISNILRTPSAFEPTDDGLSVIDIFTRRYQQAQRSLLASRVTDNNVEHGKVHQSGQVAVMQSQRSPIPQTSSPGLSLKRPTTLDYSDDDFHTSSNRTPASASAASRSSRTSPPQMASGASEPPYTPDFTDTSRSHLEGSKEKSESKIPSENSQRSEDCRRSTMSPHSHPSSPGNTASISAVLPVKSPLTPTLPSQPKRTAVSSPCSLPLSPTHEKPNSSRSPQSDPGHLEARRSPLGSNLYSTSDEEAPRSVRSRKKRGRRSPSSRKSSMSPDAHRNFRPISSPVVPTVLNQSPVVQGPPPLIPSMVGYSPSALQLKMASELNLMDMLDASTQQVADMEHLRTIALAHEESAALARILEGRQQDYERQLQLLSLKSRQEVEDAHRQLREVRETYAHEAMEMEKQQMKAEQDVAEFRRREADRLLQTQAEASRITAEAAKQLAEAHNATVKQPPPPPPVDASRLVAESTQAVATAALEQQRLHQLDVLKEMKSGFKSPPPPRRSLGVGVNMPTKTSSSRSPNRSPTPHYTEDFTQSSLSSQSYTRTASTTQSKGQQSSKSDRSIAEESLENTANGLKTPPSRESPSPVEEVISDPQLIKSPGRTSHYTRKSIESENDSSIHTDSDAKMTINDTGSISEKLNDTKSLSDEKSISFENSASEVDSVVDTSDRTLPQSRRPVGSPADNTKSPEGRSATLPGQENSLAISLQDSSSLKSPTLPVGLRANLIKQELEQEEARAHQQLMLLELREKALVDKTQAELQWLEHQKRQAKNKRDEDGLENLRRRQKNLYTKMTQEQEEIHRLKNVEILAREKRAVMMQEQERITRLQQSTQQLMAKTRTMTPMTPHLTSFESHTSGNSPERSKMTLSSTLQDQNVQPTNPSSVLSPELQTTPELSPADKQVRALQNVKLNARALSKRAINLRKRRKEAEELLAWKQKLDQEEEEVKKLEQQVKSKLKNKTSKLSEKSASPSTPSSKSVQLTPGKDTQPSTNSEISEKLDSISSGMSDTRTKSKSSAKVRSKSEKSVPEEVNGTGASASTVTEEIATEKSDSKSKKSPVLNSSSEETVKDASQIADYANESFDSVDQTLTQVKSASLSPLRTTESIKSSPSPGLLSPNRRRQDPESGSESERSLSQTFSETASDQSDIEGRIRALTDSLKKRKIEADKLRKQQKRLYREKLKAQEASLKKQLETYDSFIVQTRKELVKEKEAHPSPLAAGAKPQIKHLSISETQRKRDQSHTRALRQRTASESSVEGGVEIPKKRAHGFTENRRSSRSGAEDDNVSNRDVKESLEGEKKKPNDPTSRSRSLSGDSSITEDLSLRSLEDVSISEASLSASLKTKDSIPEETAEDSPLEKDRKKSLPDSSALSASTESEGRRDGAEQTLSGGPFDQVTNAGDDGNSREDKPETSEIPEELSSMTSNASSLSIPATPGKTFDFGKKGEGDVEEGSKSIELSVKSSRDAASPSLGDDKSQQPQKSPRSHTSSVKTLSSKRSPRTDPSYSEDFQESSMSIHIKESKSDTEDDISEHLSDRSTASGESQVSEKFVARQEDESDQVQLASVVQANELNLSSLSHQGEEKELEDSREVTVSPRIPEDRTDREVEEGTEPEVEGVPSVDPLPSLSLGCRVEVEGRDVGILRFKGPVKSRSQPLVGVELDQPNGTNDGTLDGVSYFLCAKNHGLFVSPEDVKEMVPSLQGGLSAEEDLLSQSSIHTSSGTREDDKSGLSMKFTEEFPAGENTDEAESIAEEISEGITDDAALQKVIISTAEAVESFSLDRDEPEGVESSPLDDTPRGPPEDNLSEANSVAKSETVEYVAEMLIGEVIKESITILVDVSEKQDQQEDEEDRKEEKEEEQDESTRPKSSSFLELITEGTSDVTPPVSPIPAIPEKPVRLSKDEVVQREVEFVINSLIQQTVDNMIKVRQERNKKWSRSEEKDKLSLEDAPELKTPEQVDFPAGAMKVSTPYTPDSEVPTPGDDLDSPLPDELFINRVTVQSAIMGIRDGDDTTPRARPTSPIFGESGSINPQALCDKLEQLQALDQDIFGADIFGGQEWFDDDFGTMPKSKSIIKVPRRAADDSMVPSRSPSPEEPLPKYNEARHVELKKMVEEPFMAVPHNKKEVSQIIDRAVKVVHETVEVGSPLDPLAPTAIIYGSDTIGSDIESTSKKAYKHLLFDLAKETYKTVQDEQEPVIQPPWMKPKRRPRKFLFTETPKTMAEMKTAVNVESLRILGLGQPPAAETFSKYAVKKKRDKVDEILIQELREEEQEWVDYDDDELSVKMQLTDSIFTSLLTETAAVVARIQESRLSRERQPSQSDSDIEF